MGTKRRYLAFDIETAKVQSRGARDWRAQRPLGISCAATLAVESDEPVLWHGVTRTNRPASRMCQREAIKLVEYLASQIRLGHTIVTWNGVGFDFDILAEESGMLDECRRLARDHVDMMFHIVCQLGFGVSLDCAARGMGLSGKRDGLCGAEVPKLWAEGRRQEVLDYVSQDVRITLELAKTCEVCRYFRWVTRGGSRREMPLPRGWRSVSSASRLPDPGSTWMGSQWSRKTFTAWLR